ncbi:alcohol dehydrogenase family protein [uncultured Imperialibacter sp.]|uniref:alcohol dehydrogenase family protein n=1 Tax=uncultured Imperialibacter sp. TaxID=1672639 RepID=UPI0030DB6557|tara:strand:+ start:750 stop:1796 length:1047 start_codon:yes stop_codon:yes gene_type:complete
MKAITFQGKEKLSFETVADPTIIQPTDVIVKVALTAICGSDLHVYREDEKGLDYGTVMGHEFFGEVVEIGSAVTGLKKGDRVVSPFTTSCGVCYFCKIGLTCRCQQGQLYGWVEHGHGLHGAQAEYVRVPLADSTLVKSPDGLSEEQVLLTGDIFSTGYFCAENAGVRPGGRYVVLGCGPVGLMAILAAKIQGADEIWAVDSVPERLAIAQRYGAVAVDLSKTDAKQFILEQTNGIGADAVMEVVGNPSAQQLAFDVVRPGGIISSVGVHTASNFTFSPVDAYNKNITYKTGRCPARHYMSKLLPLLGDQQIDLSAIISHRLPLAQGVEGYRIFDQKLDKSLKIILHN